MGWKKASLVGLIIGIILTIITVTVSKSGWEPTPLLGGWYLFFITYAIYILIIILITNLVYFIISKIKSKKK